MIRLPPSSTRTDTPVPYTTHFRSLRRVQYPSGHDRPRSGQRDVDAEGRLACREIAGAIDGIDDPVQPFARPVQYGGVGGAGFLPDDARFRQDGGQPFGQPDLAFLVGDGDEIVGGLLADLLGGEIPVTRPDDVPPPIAHPTPEKRRV